jgi:hypothetical protein
MNALKNSYLQNHGAKIFFYKKSAYPECVFGMQ